MKTTMKELKGLIKEEVTKTINEIAKFPVTKYVQFSSQDKLADEMDYVNNRLNHNVGKLVSSTAKGKAKFKIETLAQLRAFSNTARQQNWNVL